VPKSFSAYRASEQSVAELGFVVVTVDGRGTTGRSRAFHEYSYRNLGGVFDDHVALVKQMGAKFPYMDLSRVGIYGTSAGGYGAAHAMLVHPEFYKVCVSISGDHDARLDKAWWNELYQGYPMGEDYAAQSNLTLAGRLEGHLLLVHGDVDENVNPVETMRFADALMKANKNFDMLLVPNMYHGEGRNAYLIRRRWDYFVEHLLDVTPPRDFSIKLEEDSTRR
jgi:dipeptidyl-peptidase 4